jgi:5'-phosphate synthase pdxT subunit
MIAATASAKSRQTERMQVGVVAIQGDFERHLAALAEIDVPAREVRVPEDLDGVERLIIPGGESTTVGKLMVRFGLAAEIQRRAERGMPVWGTCMGMILMARDVTDRPEQFRLNLLDIEVERNAFGTQVHSFERELAFEGLGEPVTGVFIRAPVVRQWGPEVQPLARVGEHVVAVRSGVRLGTAFHPELTDDRRLHAYFCGIPSTRPNT